MWMMKNKTVLAVLIILGLLLCGCSNYKEIETQLGFSVYKDAVTYHFDSHGGFHGDGETVIIFYPTIEQTDFIRRNWSMEKVPAEITQNIFINGKAPFPLEELSTNNGLWVYMDQSPNSPYSQNIVFAYFDDFLVYYYELDT